MRELIIVVGTLCNYLKSIGVKDTQLEALFSKGFGLWLSVSKVIKPQRKPEAAYSPGIHLLV